MTIDDFDFDFAKVHAVMTSIPWPWRDIGVPTVEQLREHAAEMLSNLLADQSLQSISRGGFTIRRGSDEGIPYIVLDFVLESSTAIVWAGKVPVKG